MCVCVRAIYATDKAIITVTSLFTVSSGSIISYTYIHCRRRMESGSLQGAEDEQWTITHSTRTGIRRYSTSRLWSQSNIMTGYCCILSVRVSFQPVIKKNGYIRNISLCYLFVSRATRAECETSTIYLYRLIVACMRRTDYQLLNTATSS